MAPNRRTFLKWAAAGVAALHWPARALAGSLQGASGSGFSLNAVAAAPPALDMSIVPADRRTTWNPGIYGGIPQDDWDEAETPNGVGGASVYATVSSPSDIQTQLDLAGAAASITDRKIVKLNAGTWNLSSSLSIPDYVILRGTINVDGFTRDSIINSTSGSWNVFMSGARAAWGSVANVSGTLKPGDATITLVSGSVAALSLAVGDFIKLDQISDGPRSVDNGTWDSIQIDGEDHERLDTALSVSRNWDDTPAQTDECIFPNTNLTFSRADYNSPNYNGQDFPDSPGEGGDSDRGWRPVAESKEILAINGEILTVYIPPTTMAQDGINADACGSPVHFWYYRDPEVYAFKGTGSETRVYAGVEDLAIRMSSQSAVAMKNAAFCWIKNVETDGRTEIRATRNRHIDLQSDTYRCEITGCYVHGQRAASETQSYNPGGAYGINFSGSEHYIHNNVVKNHNKPINFECSSGGNVVAFNYVDNAIISTLAWTESGIGSHASFVHNELVEGNSTPNVTFDTEHGNNGFNVVFRNHLTMANSAHQSTFDDPESSVHTGQTPNGAFTRGFQSDFVNHEMACIGNVLAQPTWKANNLYAKPITERWWNLASNPQRFGYVAGFNGFKPGVDNKSHFLDDGYAFDMTYIHKDYIYVVNDGGDQLLEDVSNSESMPDSLHRTTKPSYFSGTWPWVDSEGANFAAKVLTLPAKARYDAGEA